MQSSESELELVLGRELPLGTRCQRRPTLERTVDPRTSTGRTELIRRLAEAGESDLDIVEFLLEPIEVGAFHVA